MWRNFRFLRICHVQKFEISPHDRFFLHGHRPCVRDKYEVCTVIIDRIIIISIIVIISSSKMTLPVPYVDVHYLPNQWSFVKVIVPDPHNHWFPINKKNYKIMNCWWIIQCILWSLSITWHDPQAASETFSSLAATLLRSCTIPPEFVGIMRIHKKVHALDDLSDFIYIGWGEVMRAVEKWKSSDGPHLPSQGDSQGWRLKGKRKLKVKNTENLYTIDALA